VVGRQNADIAATLHL